MKLFCSIFLCVLLTSSFNVSSKTFVNTGKDFAGHWEGVLHVTIDGRPNVFPFEMDIISAGNGKYGGKNKVIATFSDGQKIFIKCTISGSVSGHKFSFKDKKVTEQTMPAADITFFWCAKTGTLHFETGPEGEDVLKGPVNGNSPYGDCLSATAELRRKNK